MVIRIGTKCWGANTYGQLGDGTTIDRNTPVNVVNSSNFTGFNLGDYHSCANTNIGSVKCWGNNSFGQLGDGTIIDHAMPLDVGGSTSSGTIATGGFHTCVLLSSGSATCWGSNANGQLGDGTSVDRTLPVAIVFPEPPLFTSAAPPDGEYGTFYSYTFTASGSPPTFSITSGNIPPGLDLDIATGVLSGVPTTAGSYRFTIQASNGVRPDATQDVTLVVAKAPLTIMVDPINRPYGRGNPSLTYSASGYVNGDMYDTALTGALATTATSVSPVGDYFITQGTLAAANYAINLTPGTLTVSKAELIVTAMDASRHVGLPNPAFEVIYTGFINGETPSVLSGSPNCSSNATSSSLAGNYSIICTTGTLLSNNYSFAFTAGTLVVTAKQTPDITWLAPLAITYGTPLGAAQLNATASVDDQPIAGTFSYDPIAGTVLSAGNRQLLGATFIPNDSDTIASVHSHITLDVTKSKVSIHAEDKSSIVGQPLPVFTSFMTSFVNGETLATSDVTGEPYCTTTATMNSAVGDYPVTCSIGTLVTKNYDFSFIAGTLTLSVPSATINSLRASNDGYVQVQGMLSHAHQVIIALSVADAENVIDRASTVLYTINVDTTHRWEIDSAKLIPDGAYTPIDGFAPGSRITVIAQPISNGHIQGQESKAFVVVGGRQYLLLLINEGAKRTDKMIGR